MRSWLLAIALVCLLGVPLTGCQRLVVGEGGGPLRERQVAGQHDGTALVALGDDVEEQVSLFSAERQVADFVDDQQPRPDDRAVEELPQAVLLTRRRQLHHQVRENASTDDSTT